MRLVSIDATSLQERDQRNEEKSGLNRLSMT